MSTVSTFGAFSMAKLGIWASQKAMQVTGNNITNINTPGYTRQELKLDSLYAGGADRYASRWDAKTGSGVIVSGVRQIRSPYLDIRYRTENSTTGFYEDKLNGLYGLNSVLDEVGKGEDDEGVMEAAFQNMIKQLNHYNNVGAGENTFDTVFRGSVSQVLNIFNTYANKLEKLYDNTKASLREDVDTVNGILSDIRHLNVQIRKADIHGSNALELRDSRNLLIDELSRYMKINVIYDEEDIGGGVMVEKLIIRLDSEDDSSENHNGTPLVDGKYATQLKMPDVNVPEQHPEPEFKGNYDVTLDMLRDEKGVPKWLVEPQPAVFASDASLWSQTDDDGNITYTPRPEGDITIGGYTAHISAADPDPNKSDEEKVADQLREFCGQYNKDPNNTQFRASVALERNCIIFTAINSKLTPMPPADVDTTDPAQVTVTVDTNRETVMEIAGYKAKVDPNKTRDEQLQQFMEAYNSDPENAPNVARLDANGKMSFGGKPLTQGGDLTIMVPKTMVGTAKDSPEMEPYSVFIKDAENMTREEQLQAFCDIFNKDPDNNPPVSATLSKDGNQIIFKEDGDGSLQMKDYPGTITTQPAPTVPAGATSLTIDGYTVNNLDASLTDKEKLQAFCDAYNQDPDNQGKCVTLSDDGSTLIYNDTTSVRLAKNGITGVPDPENIEVELTDTDLYGALQAKRELLTEEGEFASREDLIRDPKAAEKRGIPYYQKIWDAMARKFADTLNDANTLEDETTGDLKRGANGGYIVEPKNYYLTDKNGNYIDADGNIITGDPDNPYSYKEYYTTKVDINGTETEVYADKDGKPLLSDPANPTSYITTGGTDDSYLVYSKNEKGEYLDAAGNVLKPTGQDAQGNDIYSAYLKDADGRYLNNKGQVVMANPSGTYFQYKMDASGNFVAENGTTVIQPNEDGSYWEYMTKEDPNDPTKTIYVDKAGNEITANPDGSYWDYKKDADGKFVDADGNVLTPNPDDKGYVAYKTVTKEDGTEWYVDDAGTELGEVGKGIPTGDPNDPDRDLRVPLGGDQRVYDTTKDRRVPAEDAQGHQIDRRVETDVDRRVLVDPRAFTDQRVAAIKSDKRVVREQFRGGVLISNSGNNNDREGITAKNISVSRNWGNDTIHVMQSRDNTELDQSTANSNIRHMVSIIRDNDYQFVYSDFDDAFADSAKDASYFTGSFGDLLTKICSTLADDTKKSEDRLLNSTDALTEIATDRDSVSGVDLNDEAINMMQYNKSYSAACRFMTTLDEMIDKLINGTAI